jgi:hypothetical protein
MPYLDQIPNGPDPVRMDERRYQAELTAQRNRELALDHFIETVDPEHIRQYLGEIIALLEDEAAKGNRHAQSIMRGMVDRWLEEQT